jgi:methylated-DNA-protein-cysteine methyltransferase-like protein
MIFNIISLIIKEIMQQLLENEGIQVIDNQIVDFENVFWIPILK